MKLGVFTTFMPEYTFPEACELIKAIGYDGVQPRIVPADAAVFDPEQPFNPWKNNKGGISEDDFVADPEAAMAPARKAGLQISSVASYTSCADLPRAVRLAEACGKVGIANVRIAALPMPSGAVYDAFGYLDEAQARYRELIAEATKHGVRPCLELHMGTAFPSPSGVAHFLKVFDPSEVGVLYDPANMIADGWEVPKVALNILGPYLAEVHVKNSVWVQTGVDEERGVALWKTQPADLEHGVVNWADVIDQLKEHGYDGWLVEEGHTEGRETHARISMAHELLRKLV